MALKPVADVLFSGIGVRVVQVSESLDGLTVEAVSTCRPERCLDLPMAGAAGAQLVQASRRAVAGFEALSTVARLRPD